MQSDVHTTAHTIERFRTFRYALILEGVAVGAIAGSVVVLFRLLLEQATNLLNAALAYGHSHSWWIPLWFLILAAAAFLVTLLLKWEPQISGSGIPQVEGEMLGKFDQKWWRVLVGKCVGGLLSLGCGLSLGREGPSIQLGAMAAKGFSRLTHRVKTEEKLLMTCGASAGLAAAFNAPIAGVLFSLEEVHKHFSPEILLSSMAASITADFVSKNVYGLSPVFSLDLPHMVPLHAYGHVLALGILIGAMGVLYNTCIAKSQDLYQKIPNQYLRVLIPFLLAGVFGFLYPQTLGGGHNLVETLASGEMTLAALALLLVVKFLFSMASFGSGAPGGIFLPLLVMGSLIGCLYQNAASTMFPYLGDSVGNFIILGMAGYFSAIVRAPITGIILISEMTGSFSHLLTISMVSLAAYLVPDIVKCPPIYDQLLHRMLKLRKAGGDDAEETPEPAGEKVLVEGIIYHGCKGEGLRISQISWPSTCLAVSLMRGEAEFVPRGDTTLQAGDRIVLLCDETVEELVHETLEDFCQTIPTPKKRKKS